MSGSILNITLGFQPPLKQWVDLYNHHCLPTLGGFNHRNWGKPLFQWWWKPRDNTQNSTKLIYPQTHYLNFDPAGPAIKTQQNLVSLTGESRRYLKAKTAKMGIQQVTADKVTVTWQKDEERRGKWLSKSSHGNLEPCFFRGNTVTHISRD